MPMYRLPDKAYTCRNCYLFVFLREMGRDPLGGGYYDLICPRCSNPIIRSVTFDAGGDLVSMERPPPSKYPRYRS